MRAVAQEPRAHRERPQVIGAGGFRRDQHEHEVDGQAVGRLVVDGPLQPRKDAEDLLAFRELPMRHRRAVADAGRAEALALEDRIEDFPRRKPGNRGGPFAHFLKGLLLPVDAQGGEHPIGLDDFR